MNCYEKILNTNFFGYTESAINPLSAILQNGQTHSKN